MQPAALLCSVFRAHLPPSFASLHHLAHPSSPEHCPSHLHVQGYDSTGHYLNTPSAPFSKMIKDEIEDNIFILEDYQSSLNGIVRYVENNELWDYLGEIDMVSSKIKTLISLFTK